MALHHVLYRSEPLELMTAMDVVVPQQQRPGPLPVVYQLHGLSDDHSIWLRRTTLELHAERIGCIVACLYGARSFYVDGPMGAWEQHILASVAYVDATFPTRTSRRYRAIGGFSMGGYGAVRLALRHPTVFGSCVGHAGAYDLKSRREPYIKAAIRAALGRLTPDYDLMHLAARHRGPWPHLRIDVGHDDFLLADSRRLHALLERRGVPHAYHEVPGGHHWAYAEATLAAAFDHHHAAFTKAR
jgi:S-formylglutathione hydrolase FrmB